jgi:hypothetical protein
MDILLLLNDNSVKPKNAQIESADIEQLIFPPAAELIVQSLTAQFQNKLYKPSLKEKKN